LEKEKEVWGYVRLRGGAWKVCEEGGREDEELPGEMARKEKEGHDACCAQSSSSPCDSGGGTRTNKVFFAWSTSRTHRRLSNSSAQIQMQNMPISIIAKLHFHVLSQLFGKRVIITPSKHYSHSMG
jgi:exopolysaccharide biosynthesis predicted pyruvyltransferase EpsI